MKESNCITIITTIKKIALLPITAYFYMKIHLNVALESYVKELTVCSSTSQVINMLEIILMIRMSWMIVPVYRMPLFAYLVLSMQ